MRCLEQRGDLLAGEHQRQGLGRGNPKFVEYRPAQAEFEVLAVEAAQGSLGDLHGRAPGLPHLAQFEVISADLTLRERGRVALVMVAEPADVANVFFFGGLPVIFELDKGREC